MGEVVGWAEQALKALCDRMIGFVIDKIVFDQVMPDQKLLNYALQSSIRCTWNNYQVAILAYSGI